MDLTKHIIAIILVSLLLLAQVVSIILLSARWRRRARPGLSVEALSENLTYTMLAPVVAIIVSLVDPGVHAFVIGNIAAWFFTSVIVIGVITKVFELRYQH